METYFSTFPASDGRLQTSTPARLERRLAGDIKLQRRAATLPAEIGFLAAYGVPPGVLLRAAAAAETLGVPADEVLRADGGIDEVRYYRALAHHLDLGFTLGPLTLAASTGAAAATTGAARLAGFHGPQFVLAPTGKRVVALMRQGAERRERRAIFVLTTPSHLAEAVRRTAAQAIAGAASCGLPHFDPGLSAAPRGTDFASRSLYVALLLGFTGLVFSALLLPAAVLFAVSLLLLAAVALRLCVCAVSCDLPVTAVKPLSDAALPRYTLLVPLYREARIVRQLHAALEALDYPRAKLEVKFILEADDPTTAAALRALPLGPIYEIIIAPPGEPRTKPRALNFALPFARGELVAVFDAEDEPEPGELREAAARMRAAPPDVACLQARLALYNVGDSWLSRCFALDFAALFDVTNVGLAALRLPLPLGGTSNHFRASALHKVGGWDAWNVTEDADLGLRLARFGFRTEVLAATTTEEAPAALGSWFRQRRRWFKGWQQTQMTLFRDPRRLVAELGLRRMLLTALLLLAQVQAPLIWPVSTLMLGWRLVADGFPAPDSLLDLIAVTAWVSLTVAGAGLTVFSTWLGLRRRRLGRLWPWLPALLAYKLLVSAAAWASVLDLLRHPHRWDKTEHGAWWREDMS